MSQENVEIVRRGIEAFADGSLDAMAEFWDPEISWRAIEGAPDDGGEMQGREALRRYYQDWLDMFDDITNVPEELIDVGDGRVVAVQHVTGRAKTSGVQTQLGYAVVYTVSNGKDRARPGIHRSSRGPRSRGASGVGSRRRGHAPGQPGRGVSSKCPASKSVPVALSEAGM